ncbi:MAG: cytochrome c maturation protein CcmE [Methanosarcinales archaeon]|nr:cytochrome c maturation protein CcmE [Methanosarcinales archaeon]
MRKKDKIAIVLVGIILVVIVGMWGLDFSSQYLTVTDIKMNASVYINRPVEITGNVKPDTLSIEGTQTFFILTDNISDIDVHYRGEIVPQLAEGAKVSVRGILVSEDRVDANFLVMGCPSKYGI